MGRRPSGHEPVDGIEVIPVERLEDVRIVTDPVYVVGIEGGHDCSWTIVP